MTTNLFGLGLKAIVTQDVNWETDTIKVALTNNYVFSASNQDLHDFWVDVEGFEVAASGTYVAGGAALTTPAPVYNDALNAVLLSASANVVWTGATITATGAMVYKDSGVNTTSPLLAYIDFAGSKAATDGSFTLDFTTNPVIKIVAL
jgi:hypothetical protein